MSYKKEPLIKAIADNLAFSSESTARKNVIGLFDSNRIAQDFFAGLFKLVFDYSHLKELDKLNDIVNYPAIDLGDEIAKIAFQVTTKKDSEKVKDTIKKFISHKLYEKYDKLIIFIIGEKQNSYTTTFDTQSKFTFDKNADIWDDNFLIKEIDKITEISKLEEIKKFLEENLLEFKFPENLLDQDIEKCIEILKRDFGSIKKIEENIPKRSENFIEEKNKLNNLSWEYFKEKMKGHWQYNEQIIFFLGMPVNKDLEKDYFDVTQAINNFHKEKNIISFEDVFSKIFKELNVNDYPKYAVKLQILLHNMYLNCDIGYNPNDND